MISLITTNCLKLGRAPTSSTDEFRQELTLNCRLAWADCDSLFVVANTSNGISKIGQRHSCQSLRLADKLQTSKLFWSCPSDAFDLETNERTLASQTRNNQNVCRAHNGTTFETHHWDDDEQQQHVDRYADPIRHQVPTRRRNSNDDCTCEMSSLLRTSN